MLLTRACAVILARFEARYFDLLRFRLFQDGSLLTNGELTSINTRN